MESFQLGGDSMRHTAKRVVSQWLVFSAVMLSAEWVLGQGLTAEQIVDRIQVNNAERQAALEHYTSERTYRVEYKGTGGEHFGQIIVHAEYSAPDQRRFSVVSESGSKAICQKVLQRLVESEQEATQKANSLQTALSLDNYNVVLDGAEQIGGSKAWILKVTPKVASKFTYRGTVWVDAVDYAVMRVRGEPAKNPSWWINRTSFDSRYVRRNGFWLPQRNVSTSHVRIGGEATLTIDYGSYETLAGRAIGSSRTNNASASRAVNEKPMNEKGVMASVIAPVAASTLDPGGAPQ
jgi:hypothetical protein